MSDEDFMRAAEYGLLVADAVKGCCGNAKWRGRFCTYHEGYTDCIDRMLQREVALAARVAQLEACLTDVKEQLEMRGIRE